MKAFLLAAGYGTRLKPLTDSIPKCLVPINGKPLLEIWLELLEREGVTDVLVNTHYLSERVEEFICYRNNKINVELFHEDVLLGSGGTLLANKAFIRNDKDFYFLYADNITNISLNKLLRFHRSNNSIFSTYVYETKIPQQKGIFTADMKTGKVLGFEEKPKHPKSNLANAGIGILNNKIFNYLKDNKPFVDFGKDVMPELVDQMHIILTDKYIKDIGTINDYLQAQKEWKLITEI